jgi:hypothetical protein
MGGPKTYSLPWSRSGFLEPTFILVERMILRGGISHLSHRFPIEPPNLNISPFLTAKVITGNKFVGSGFLATMRDPPHRVHLLWDQVRDLFLAHVFDGEIFHLFFFLSSCFWSNLERDPHTDPMQPRPISNDILLPLPIFFFVEPNRTDHDLWRGEEVCWKYRGL